MPRRQAEFIDDRGFLLVHKKLQSLLYQRLFLRIEDKILFPIEAGIKNQLISPIGNTLLEPSRGGPTHDIFLPENFSSYRNPA